MQDTYLKCGQKHTFIRSCDESSSSTGSLRTDKNDQGPVSRKSRKLFGPEKPFVKLRTANSAGLVFSCVVNGKQLKHTAKFGASRRLRFEDTKRIMSPEKRPKSFGTFEKKVPAPSGLDSSTGRALHRHRRGHGLESRSSLGFFRLSFVITYAALIIAAMNLKIIV